MHSPVRYAYGNNGNGHLPAQGGHELGEEEGRVGLSYQLDIDGRFTSSNNISVTYRTVH